MISPVRAIRPAVVPHPVDPIPHSNRADDSIQEAPRLVADIFDRVLVTLGYVADVPRRHALGPVTPVRAEHRHADLSEEFKLIRSHHTVD